MFRISTGYTTSSKTGIPFRVHPHAMAATGGETSRPVGSVRASSRPEPQGRAIGTSAACSPAWLIIQSTTASFTGCAALHAGRGGPQKRGPGACYTSAPLPPASHSAPNAPRFRPTRTHPFRHPTHPSVRTHPATIPFPPAKPNQLRGIHNLHAHTSHLSHPL